MRDGLKMKFSQLLNRKDSTKEKAEIAYVRGSDLFDERWYVSQYQDVFKKLKDPARHYYRSGWKENRDPSDSFSTAAYLKKYPECGICPIIFERNRNGYVDLSICAIMKNEAPYVKEWLDYHRLVGVKRFYIYDNESTDNLKEVLTPYIKQGIVVYKYYPGNARQMSAYNECIREYKNNTEWLAVISADEFIIPMEDASIPEFLQDYKQYSGVGINWIDYDSDGHVKKPKGGVLESYTRVHYDEQFINNHHIKCIVKPGTVLKFTNPHYAIYVNGENAVNENFEELKGCVYRNTNPKAFSDIVSADKIRINRYYSKSEEEYRDKIEQSASSKSGKKREFSKRDYVFDDCKYDYTAYKFAVQLNPAIRKREELHYAWIRLKNVFVRLKHLFRRSRLFDYIDEKWYFEQYPDAKESGMSALQHYLSIGWREGKNPSIYFDTNFYLKRYPDIAKADVNPLLHYVTYGKEVGRLPKPENEDKTEDAILLDIDEKNKDYQLLNASDVFDKEWYMREYLNGKDIDPVWHYLQVGWKEGCNPSKEFDTKFYLSSYSDVAKSGKNPFLHYIKHGWIEGRVAKPLGVFEALQQKIDKLMHRGTTISDTDYEIVSTSKLFDKKWYAKKYLSNYKVCPVRHYLTGGWQEGLDPSEDFVTAEYLKQYPECSICPIIFEHNRNGYVDLAICAIMKNEAPYVKEWLDYHLMVGVKRFYIYDNGSTDDMKEVLKPYIEKGVVVYKYYPGDSKQIPAYNECISEYKDKNEWIAFIDIDEFMVPVEKETVPEFLKDYKKYSGVEMNWVHYDSNGYVAKPKGGVLESYTRRQYEIQSLKNHRGKSVVQPLRVKEMHVHTAYYLDKETAVTENKQPVLSGDFTDWVSVNKIRLHHYYCKSAEEAIAKVAKGNPYKAEKVRKVAGKDLCFDEYIYDFCMYKYLLRLYPNKSIKFACQKAIYTIKNYFINLRHKIGKNTISDYINEKWYFEQYPEAKKSGMTALEHYLSVGWKEGKNPSEMFDTEFYLKKYPDIAKTGHNPLLHYITYGKNAGRLPKSLQVFLADEKEKPEEITVTKSRKTDYEILDNSGLLDKEWYIKSYLSGQNNIDPVKHYLKFGWKNGCNPSRRFDTEFYLKKYKDVARSGHNPLLHYVKHGAEEGRLPKSPYSWLYGWWQNIFSGKKQFISEYGVTVIVPTYNRKTYLQKALNMLKSQTLDTIKFIIIDDGSTDGSTDCIEELIKGDKRFMFIKNDENQGPSAARNKAMAFVNTEYVGFFDIDDEIPDDYFDGLYSQAIKNSADIIYTNYNKEQHRVKKISNEADKYRALRNGAIWDKLYSTALLKKNNIRFAEHLYTADNLFNIEALYELHNDSIGKDEKLADKRKKDIINICNMALDFAMEKNDFDMATLTGLYDFLRRTYDCYADDSEFQKKLNSVLKRTGISVNVSAIVGKYSKKEYDLVKESEYFNPQYYVRHTPQLWFGSVDPVEHYLTVGWLEGKNPSAEFDGNKYLELNEDVAASGINPLLHYIKHGKEEARLYEAVESMGEKIKRTLEYPIRVKEEYDRLSAEIKALENIK